MKNARYLFYYVTGEREEIETEYEYNEDARQKLAMTKHSNQKWFYARR